MSSTMIQLTSYTEESYGEAAAGISQKTTPDYETEENIVEVMQGQTIAPSTDPGVFGHPMPHPAMLGMPVTQASMVLAGYRDCAAEAVRYLIEEEHMNPDDPFVVGLRNHLYECQKRLDLHNILHHMAMTQSANEHTSFLDDSGIADDVTDSSVYNQDANVCLTNNQHNDISPQNISMDSIENNSPAITALAQELFLLLEEEEADQEMSDSEQDVVEQ